MIDHIGLGVSDYQASRAFYLAALAPLDYGLVMEIAAAGLGAAGKPDFWIARGAATTPKSRDEVVAAGYQNLC